MKITRISNDNEVKAIWRKTAEYSIYLFIAFNVIRILLKFYNRNNGGKYEIVEIIFSWMGIFFLLLSALITVIYWIKPSLFKMNKEQKVQE